MKANVQKKINTLSVITSSFHLPAVQFQKQHTTERSLLFEKLKKKY